MFKMILAVVASLEPKLIKGDFQEVNRIMSGFNSYTNKVTLKTKDTGLENIELLIERAKAMNITLPDLAVTASQQLE